MKKDNSPKRSVAVSGDMLKSYLAATLRHLLKSKLNFFFKLGGLTLALTSLLVIILYVSYELSFDRYHEDYQNIYRVNARWMENGSLASYAIVPPAVGPALKDEFPEIKTFARIGFSSQYVVKYKERSLRIFGFVTADTSVFDVLTLHFIRGDRHALDQPNSIILTQSLAHQIFGNDDPMDKTLSFTDRSSQVYQVSAIVDDPPSDSHIYIRALLPPDALRDSIELASDPWHIGIDGSGPLYVRLDAKADVTAFTAKATSFLRKRLTSGEDHLEKDYEIYLQPIKDIHLARWIAADFTKKGDAVYVYVFSLLGIFLLIIAAINYVNLSIADFHKRSKEIGVRKILGAKRRQVAVHVIMETVFVCLCATVISVGILYIVFPYIVQTLEKDLAFSMLFRGNVPLLVGGIIIFLTVSSSLYPAWHLAANKPVNDFKSISAVGKNSAGRFLLLVQFTISVISIAATFIVGQQIRFFQMKDPGYNRENTIVLFMPDRYPSEKIAVIKDELSKVPGVDAVSYSTFLIVGGYYRDWYRVEINGEMKQMLLNEVFFDHDFFRTMGIELVVGRSFDPDNPADPHAAFIVNETAVREFGWKDPIGKRIDYGYTESEGEKWEGTVIGVVKDFNVYSMRRKIEPLVMRLPWSDWPGQCVHVKISGPLHETIAGIEAKYKEILPDFLIDYHLIGELYDNQYQNEQKAFSSLRLGTWIIVLISALGIFSLSAYMSVRRMKEFGIRKVLGATVRQITFLHVGYFLRIAVVANVIALPIAWLLMNEWLSEFAYRTELNAVMFAGVMMISFLLVIFSAGYSSWKAGVMNPVDVIKTEP